MARPPAERQRAAGERTARERKQQPASPTGRRASWRARAEGQPPQAAVRPVSESQLFP